MTTRSITCALALLLTFASRPILAEHEGPEAHGKGNTKTVVLDGNDVRPADLEMAHGDVISFVNYSTNAIQLTFVEPKDLENKVRCGLVRDAKAKGTPAAPWALFQWQDGKLVANVPPGQFASVCAFAPGHYAFTAEAIGHKAGATAAGTVLAAKGQIDVQ